MRDIKDILKLLEVLGAGSSESNSLSYPIGEYVIVRSRSEGVNAGYLEQADSAGCVLSQCRRLWHHKPKRSCESWYEGVAVSGLSEDSKISCKVDKKIIIENYSITLCSDESKRSIEGFKSHES